MATTYEYPPDDPGTLDGFRSALEQQAANLDKAESRIASARTELQSAWEGQGADAASASCNKLLQGCNDNAARLKTCIQAVSAYRDTIAAIRMEIDQLNSDQSQRENLGNAVKAAKASGNVVLQAQARAAYQAHVDSIGDLDARYAALEQQATAAAHACSNMLNRNKPVSMKVVAPAPKPVPTPKPKPGETNPWPGRTGGGSGGGGGGSAGGGASSGVVSDYVPPAVTGEGAGSEQAKNAVAWAYSKLGLPYVWGGTGPNGYDCSGLTSQAWLNAGVEIPRTAQQQFNACQRIDYADMQPGDLIFFGSGPGHITHVAMYVGDGQMIEAPRPGKSIQIGPVRTSGAMPYAGRPTV